MNKSKKRCDFIGCKTKIHLIKFDCECNKSFCIKHHNKHSHNCLIIMDNKKKIENNNPVIKASTLIKI